MANDWSQEIAEYSRDLAHFDRKKIKKYWVKIKAVSENGVTFKGFDERQVMPFTFDIQAVFCRPTSIFGQLIDR